MKIQSYRILISHRNTYWYFSIYIWKNGLLIDLVVATSLEWVCTTTAGFRRAIEILKETNTVLSNSSNIHPTPIANIRVWHDTYTRDDSMLSINSSNRSALIEE